MFTVYLLYTSYLGLDIFIFLVLYYTLKLCGDYITGGKSFLEFLFYTIWSINSFVLKKKFGIDSISEEMEPLKFIFAL